MPRLSRRDLLKLTIAASGGLAFSRLIPQMTRTRIDQSSSVPNILIFVFDAMSAKNLSLYGYKRKTTPNLERFAQRATVYNTHYSAGSFTTPGTASLLTGMYPWTHRAINVAGLIARNLTDRNLFKLAGLGRRRLAFSQNMWPNYFFDQFQPDIDKILPPGSFSRIDYLLGEKFEKDGETSERALDDFLFQDGYPPASLIFGLADRVSLRSTVDRTSQAGYPLGLPRVSAYPLYFRLEDVFSGLIASVENLTSSTLAYFHLWPPHDPYSPPQEYFQSFADGWNPIEKPVHDLGDQLPIETLNSQRQTYDEYIASLDNEFGRLLDFLESQHILETSYVVITSDHGELFERGERGHVSPLLYEAGIRVPLMISSPGQQSRQDIFAPTNSVDVLPTLIHLAGGTIPDWHEGELLPGLGGHEIPGRSIFSLYAFFNPAFQPLTKITVAMRKDNYKVIYYRGFYPQDKYELYDLTRDSEEMNDLFPTSPLIAAPLQAELLAKLAAADSKYER
jgi:arylsulfatase A-like enzyme